MTTNLTGLLRFSPGLERDPEVAAWFAGRSGELRTIAERWFARMRSAGPDVRELVHDGCPVVCLDAAPFAYVNVFTAHVNVGFFHGAALSDPSALLQGSGKHMRHVKVRPDADIDGSALEALIAAAYRDISARVSGSERLHLTDERTP